MKIVQESLALTHNAKLSGGREANAESPSGGGPDRAGANSSHWLRR